MNRTSVPEMRPKRNGAPAGRLGSSRRDPLHRPGGGPVVARSSRATTRSPAETPRAATSGARGQAARGRVRDCPRAGVGEQAVVDRFGLFGCLGDESLDSGPRPSRRCSWVSRPSRSRDAEARGTEMDQRSARQVVAGATVDSPAREVHDECDRHRTLRRAWLVRGAGATLATDTDRINRGSRSRLRATRWDDLRRPPRRRHPRRSGRLLSAASGRRLSVGAEIPALGPRRYP
jgi:hypothetical protein